MRKRKPARKRLTDDDIDDRVFKAVDYAESMLKRGVWTREDYNSFLVDLTKWQIGKRP